MKKIMVCLGIALLCIIPVWAQGGTEQAPAPVAATPVKQLSGTLTVATNCGEPTLGAMQDVINSFMKANPGVKVEYTSYTKDYENLMKAKMAANDLPDVFATHGWGVNRYAEYLMSLNNLSFAPNFTDAIKPVITTKDGRIVTMPVTIDEKGIIYNKDILKKAGWNEPPKTWKEFMKCCDDVKKLGVIPVYIAGKDNRSQASFLDTCAPTCLVTSPKDDNSKALLDGTFDWSKWGRVAGLLKDLSDQGYLNVDANTADTIYRPEKLANGETMFVFSDQATIADAWSLNPNVALSMMPVPTYYDDDQPVLVGGERESYGIWKDTKQKEIAIAFLEFLAQPENIKYVSEKTEMAIGFKGIDVNLRLSKDMKAYENLRIMPIFDREWLPSGMWATMRTTGAGLTSGQISVEQACQQMKANYDKLMSQKK